MPTRVKTHAQRIAAQEKKLVDQLAATHADLEPATSLAQTLQEEREAATETLEDIVSAWRTLSPTDPDPSDYLNAQAATVRATERAEGATARLQGLRRSTAVNVDKGLAEIAARAVRLAVPGVEVLPTFLADPPAPGVADNLPVVLISVLEVKRSEEDGFVLGRVVIDYYRDKLFARLDSQSLREAAREELEPQGSGIKAPTADATGGVRTTALSTGLSRDRLVVEVWGWPSAPRLGTLTSSPVVSSHLAAAVARGLSEGETPTSPLPGKPAFMTRRHRVLGEGDVPIGESIRGKERTATLDATLIVQTDSTAGSRTADACVRSVLDGLVGRTIPGFGMVEKVEQASPRLDHDKAVARVRSAIPRSGGSAPHGFETLQVVTVRVTAKSLVV